MERNGNSKAKKLVIPGGSGFLGRMLSCWFAERGWKVIVLSRRATPVEGAKVVHWDGRTKGVWCKELENAAAVINLAGQSVDCRYTPRNRTILFESRILSTRVLGEAIRGCERPPAVWMNASTATIYEHTFGPGQTEARGRIAGNPEAKDEFSVDLAAAWEHEFDAAQCPETRKLTLRMAMVFAEHGSVFPVLKRLVRFGLGGKMGHGRQYVSWTHARDFCRAIQHLVEDDTCCGVYNVSSPNPLSNEEMMQRIRSYLGMPVGLPAAKWMLELGAVFLRTETELIIKSRNVLPERLLQEGFQFEYPTFQSALDSFSPGSRSALTAQQQAA